MAILLFFRAEILPVGVDVARLYFSLCSQDAESLARKMVAECEAFLEGECLLIQEDESFPPEEVHQHLLHCDALILVIGEDTPSGRFQERVRMEIVSAVNQDMLIVPLLVENARLPDKKSAQGAVKRLLESKTYRVRSGTWFEDLHSLLEDVQEEIDFKHEVERKLSESMQSNYLGPVDSEGKPLPPQKLGSESSNALELRRVVESERFNLKEARRKRDREGEMNALSALGLAFTQLGQVQKAIEYFEDQLAVVRNTDDLEKLCSVLANLGDACAVSGNIHRAQGYYEEQLCLADEGGYRSHVASALNGLGFVRVKQAKIPDAIGCYGKALVIYKELEDHDKELELLVGIGLNYKKLGDWSRTAKFLEQALQVAKFVENRKEEACILIDLAEAAITLGQKASAENYLDRAEEILNHTEDSWTAPWKQSLIRLRQSSNPT